MNTTTNSTANISTEPVISVFKFRNMFKPLLNDENCVDIDSTFYRFCRLAEGNALNALWDLTFRKDVSLSLEWLGLKPASIPEDKVSVLRNELRHQYKKVHPDFMEPKLPESCKEAFKEVEKKTDAITANVVYGRILRRLYLNGDTDRTIFLLKCEQEKMYCGGLYDIGFFKDEVVYLKPYHEQIRDLFEVMYKQMFGDAEPNRPFADLKERLDEAGIEVVPVSWTQAKATPPTSTAYDSKATPEQPNKAQTEVTKDKEEDSMATITITVSTILAHKDDFLGLYANSQSMEWMKKLRDCGFDLNEIAKKWDLLQEMLKSANNLGF